MLEPLCKRVACCVRPISDTGCKYANKDINPGFTSLQWNICSWIPRIHC